MAFMFIKQFGVIFVLAAAACCAQATKQAPKQEYGVGWQPEFAFTAREAMMLAEATPAEKFTWRPAPGVRSIGEVYVHIAIAHFYFLSSCGVKVDM
jgi:hypothetical protein